MTLSGPGNSLVSDEEVRDLVSWSGPRTLMLVMDEGGGEMRAMSEGQITALAQKSGCEFAMGAEGFPRGLGLRGGCGRLGVRRDALARIALSSDRCA